MQENSDCGRTTMTEAYCLKSTDKKDEGFFLTIYWFNRKKIWSNFELNHSWINEIHYGGVTCSRRPGFCTSKNTQMIWKSSIEYSINPDCTLFCWSWDTSKKRGTMIVGLLRKLGSIDRIQEVISVSLTVWNQIALFSSPKRQRVEGNQLSLKLKCCRSKRQLKWLRSVSWLVALLLSLFVERPNLSTNQLAERHSCL